jgi:hypothetical protein
LLLSLRDEPRRIQLNYPQERRRNRRVVYRHGLNSGLEEHGIPFLMYFAERQRLILLIYELM